MRIPDPVQKIFFSALIATLAALAAGCGSCKPGKPGPIGRYQIDVNRDESLKPASVLVDLVGINAASLPRWESYSMRKYWEDNDAMRRDADKVTLTFDANGALTNSLALKSPKWDQWKTKGVTHVLVLADLPGGHTDKPGTQDPRRQVLPLDRCAWPKGTSRLTVNLKRSGIDIVTPPRVGK